MNIDKQYNKNTNIAYIARSKEFTEEDGTKGTTTEIYKKVYNGKHFWRVWLGDLLTALGLINNSKQLDVVFYIFDNTRASDNLFIGTIRAIAEEMKISTKTVATTIKKLQEADIITKKQNGVYMVKPELMVKGDDYKQHTLIIQYDKLKQEQKNESDTRTDTTSEADKPI